MTDRTLTGESRERLVNAGVGSGDRAAPDPRGHEDDRATTPRDRGTPTDAGKTGGGGSQGHKQPKDVTDAAPIRNNPD
jgi:hypothetical protein